ncbi:MAG TPA: glycosyltransferase family 4 protein [Chlamydiales bacterium]|nr:glycosyltransferase family 4 protein [Chlamydiales bacterium]
MRILHLEASPGWGGQEMRILREAEEMRSRGHEVFLVVMQRGQLIEEACKAGFTAYPLNFHKPYWLLCLIRLLLLIRRHRIDLINTHSSLDAWIGGLAARISRRPVIRTRHLSTPIKPGWNSRILYGKLADFIVTTCSSILPMIRLQSGKKESECKSIPTGVDPARICYAEEDVQNIRSKLGVLQGDVLIGTACFLRSWKGIADFLKAADLLRESRDIKWVVIGGGHEAFYREMAAKMKLDGIVHFTGHLKNPFAAMAALDVFALLSTAHEGVSQAILQAAYLEKPLVSTPIGGLDEVCLHGITGIRVEPFSASQVAKAVLKLKENAPLRRLLGRNGKKLIEEKFTLQETIDQMERIYLQRLLGN